MSKLDTQRNVKVIDGALKFLELAEYEIIPDEDDIVSNEILLYGTDNGDGTTRLGYLDNNVKSGHLAFNGEVFAIRTVTGNIDSQGSDKGKYIRCTQASVIQLKSGQHATKDVFYVSNRGTGAVSLGDDSGNSIINGLTSVATGDTVTVITISAGEFDVIGGS